MQHAQTDVRLLSAWVDIKTRSRQTNTSGRGHTSCILLPNPYAALATASSFIAFGDFAEIKRCALGARNRYLDGGPCFTHWIINRQRM